MISAIRRAAAFLLCACLLAGAGALPTSAAGEAPDGAIVIRDRAGLEAIAQDPAGSYLLAADIDMAGEPWAPIAFSGSLDGAGHTLYNLSITEADPETAISVDGNDKQYPTVFAALFSRAYNASIQDLHLLGVDVRVSTPQNAFASCLVGYAENVQLSGCSAQGRVYLAMGDTNCGVAGLVGFGYGTATACSVDVELTLVDENRESKSEEFMGGILATGYLDVSGCDVRVRAYTSVYGYVHNGGIVGMYYVHTDDTGHQGYVSGNTSDAEIYFFEANDDRRAYCDPVVGEQLNWSMGIENNTVTHFVDGETTDYSKTLSAERCDTPQYETTATEADCDHFGYTTHTCAGCGYSYTSNYLAPAHQPGDWKVVRQPAGDQPGQRARTCKVCGSIVDTAAFTAVTALSLNSTSLRLQPDEAAQLAPTVKPADAAGSLGYASSDEAVATVDADGLVTAVAPGTATITCAAPDGGMTATCAVRVGGGGSLGDLAIWQLALIILAAAVIVLLVILLAIRHNNLKKRRARRAAQQRARQDTDRQVYRR